jgi:hypothetical protein
MESYAETFEEPTQSVAQKNWTREFESLKEKIVNEIDLGDEFSVFFVAKLFQKLQTYQECSQKDILERQKVHLFELINFYLLLKDLYWIKIKKKINPQKALA